MPSIEAMARAIAESDGNGLEAEFKEQLYRRLVQLGHDAPLRLEGRYAAFLSPPKEEAS